MSFRTHIARSTLLTVGVALSTLGAASAQADLSIPEVGGPQIGDTLRVRYECGFPLTPTALFAAEVTTSNASSGGFSAHIRFSSLPDSFGDDNALRSLQTLQAASLRGRGILSTTVGVPAATGGTVSFPVALPFTVPEVAVPSASPWAFDADGVTVPITSPNPSAPASLGLGDMKLNLAALDAGGNPIPQFSQSQSADPTDSDPNTFDVVCKPVGVPDVVPPVTPTPSPSPSPTVTPAPPTPYPEPDIYGFGISGSAKLKTLVTGAVPLTGSGVLAVERGSGSMYGPLTFGVSQAQLVALGFLPVTAKIQLVPLTPLSGTRTSSGGLTATTTVRIKVPSASIVGIPFVQTGTNCQAKNPSALKLTSQGAFGATTGGTLAGTFSISDLTGCGYLNGLVSSLTAGSGNAIALRFTPNA